jgi:hypothetical protein
MLSNVFKSMEERSVRIYKECSTVELAVNQFEHIIATIINEKRSHY